jgi:hypothetical protein
MALRLAARALLWAHVAGAAVFLWLQPRGFAAGSRGFWEHQVVVPLFFVVSLTAAACPARRARVRDVALGALIGFWSTASAVVVGVGTTTFAYALAGPLVAAIGSAVLLLRRKEPRPPLLGGAAGGALLATAFLACTWAPPASTRPLRPESGRSRESGPADRTPPKLRYSIEGRRVLVSRGDERLAIDPTFHFHSLSPSGLWTVFDYRSLHLPPWTHSASQPGAGLEAAVDGLQALGQVWIEADGVHLRIGTRVERDVAAHLTSVMTVEAAGPVRVEGVAWPDSGPDDRPSFLAFRGSSLELLRAAHQEKGPFETLASWTPRDPAITMGAWRVQVRGWAEQASREPSPTAGWGVSQGAVEYWGDTLIWSLASTSIGRGWHAVRTAQGFYLLEAVISPAAP